MDLSLGYLQIYGTRWGWWIFTWCIKIILGRPHCCVWLSSFDLIPVHNIFSQLWGQLVDTFLPWFLTQEDDMCEDVVPTGWADEISCQLQAIAGIVEHWIADYLLASQPLLGCILSFVARTGNSYWGTQVTSWLIFSPPSSLFQSLNLILKLNADTKMDW